jgi:hypothetical protein
MTFISTARVITEAEAQSLRDTPGFGGDSISDGYTKAALHMGRPAFWNLVTYHEAGISSAADRANITSLIDAVAYLRESLRRAEVSPKRTEESIKRLLSRLAPANELGLQCLRDVVDLMHLEAERT